MHFYAWVIAVKGVWFKLLRVICCSGMFSVESITETWSILEGQFNQYMMYLCNNACMILVNNCSIKGHFTMQGSSGRLYSCTVFHYFLNDGKVLYMPSCIVVFFWCQHIPEWYFIRRAALIMRPDTVLPVRFFLWPLFRVCSSELKFGVSKGQSKMWQSF